MLNTHKDWMAGKSATANNKDDLIQTEGTASNVPSTKSTTSEKQNLHSDSNRSLLKESHSVSTTCT
ncbi:hypothetical protein [Parabacteroides johnsonii]|uniref:hypothetical protein n=1 Tax=Parabacteroides johnsonii TaxID=387661 RepID=UPI003AB7F0E3